VVVNSTAMLGEQPDGRRKMISEDEFQRQWRRLFRDTAIEKSTVRKARKLVDQLPHVSPLRVRFEKELDEIEITINGMS